MSKLLRNRRVLLLLVLGLTVLSIAGGAVGAAFGLGFLGSPLSHIQLSAEAITSELFLGWKITNTMIAAWVSMLVLLAIAFFSTRRITEVPRGLQNLVEVVFEFFLNLSSAIAGPRRARRFFPLVVTIFLFIVTSNWLGILPGFGTIGKVETADEIIHHAEEEAEKKHEPLNLSEIKLQVFDDEGFLAIQNFGSVKGEITAAEYKEHGVPEGKRAGRLVPFLRSANTEVNTTLAIALVAMFMVHFWGLRTLGFFGHMGKFITFKGGPTGFLVGALEGMSEFGKIISLTFRLFGNIFAGEVLLAAMGFLLPLFAGIVVFFVLEIFVGLMQAIIFAVLTLVFATAATTAAHGVAEAHHQERH